MPDINRSPESITQNLSEKDISRNAIEKGSNVTKNVNLLAFGNEDVELDQIILRSGAPDPSKMHVKNTKDKKEHYCGFCNKKVHRYGRHLAVHEKIPEVALILKMEKKSKQFKAVIDNLRIAHDSK